MTGIYVLCTDGSELANRAIAAGLSLLRPGPRAVVVTVVELADPTLVTGAGMAGGTMSPEQFDELEGRLASEGEAIVNEAAAELGSTDVEVRVLRGEPKSVLCEFAREIGADALVIGSRGRGGVKRALLGSVSDFVVRNAPCPVVVTSGS
jgi:nucleotide-binding universal stress UspA family protein